MTVTEDQKRLVIVGATIVGGRALRYALDHPTVGGATAIGRKPTGLAHPKLKEVLHQDFADCSALAGALWVASGPRRLTALAALRTSTQWPPHAKPQVLEIARPLR